MEVAAVKLSALRDAVEMNKTHLCLRLLFLLGKYCPYHFQDVCLPVSFSFFIFLLHTYKMKGIEHILFMGYLGASFCLCKILIMQVYIIEMTISKVLSLGQD